MAHRTRWLAWCLVLASGSTAAAQTTPLRAPDLEGTVTLERALSQRRSNRRVAKTPLSLETIGQLLWAAQGVTNNKGFRTAPSAGARYPLEIYVLIPGGLFRYVPKKHALVQLSDKDLRRAVWKHAYARAWLADAPAIFFIAGVYGRTAGKYGQRARRYVHIEVGHAGQNLLLQAAALGLHCVGVGAFSDRQVQKTLGLPAAHVPLYAIPVGRPPAR